MKKILFTFVLIGILTGPVVLAADYGLKETATEAGLLKSDIVSKPGDLPATIGILGGAALSLVGIAFFIFIIYGGYKWMLARGNEEDAKKAIDTIFSAIIGLIIVLFAYAITAFVFGAII